MKKNQKDIVVGVNHARREQSDDVYCLGLLQPLIGNNYMPFTNAAMRPACIAFILNDIVINSRESIIEFGSGVSTLLIGRLIKKNKLKCRLVSVEHIGAWANKMKEMIREEGLDKIIKIIHAPLAACPLAINSCQWYNISLVEKEIRASKFDMVIIDGPPAYMLSISMSRYPAYPFIIKRLFKKSIVVLDDANRDGEQMIIKKWQDDYGARFKFLFGSLAYSTAGEAFNCEIFKY